MTANFPCTPTRDESSTGEAEGPGTSLVLVPGLRPTVKAPPPSDRLLLRPVEAAHLLGIGRSKIFDLMARRQVPVVRIGRCARIPLRELTEWIERNVESPVW